mmetsp:Transcript_39978/g.98912  ORF Transcript_39978/g.98912 Transcript_39978/m.98912 type:complete len:209 (+) Transcript_39978:544-1170(+)
MVAPPGAPARGPQRTGGRAGGVSGAPGAPGGAGAGRQHAPGAARGHRGSAGAQGAERSAQRAGGVAREHRTVQGTGGTHGQRQSPKAAPRHPVPRLQVPGGAVGAQQPAGGAPLHPRPGARVEEAGRGRQPLGVFPGRLSAALSRGALVLRKPADRAPAGPCGLHDASHPQPGWQPPHSAGHRGRRRGQPAVAANALGGGQLDLQDRA